MGGRTPAAAASPTLRVNCLPPELPFACCPVYTSTGRHSESLLPINSHTCTQCTAIMMLGRAGSSCFSHSLQLLGQSTQPPEFTPSVNNTHFFHTSTQDGLGSSPSLERLPKKSRRWREVIPGRGGDLLLAEQQIYAGQDAPLYSEGFMGL